MAIASLVTGILSFVSAGIFFVCCGFFAVIGTVVSGPLALASVVLAYIDWRRINNGESPEAGKTMVFAGGGIGALCLLLNVGVFAVTVLYFFAVGLLI